MTKPIVALIGIGRWGRNLARVLSSDAVDATLAHIVYSGRPETTDFLRETYPDIPTTTALETVLEDQSITHVCVATPIDTHVAITRQCLEAGKHTFVEKPLATTAVDADALHTLAAAQDRTLASGYVYLFDESLQKLCDLAHASTTTTLRCNWEKWGTFDSPITTNLLVHELAIAHLLMGRFEKLVTAQVAEHKVTLELIYTRGSVTISIDREQKEKRKWLEATIDGTTYQLEAGALAKLTSNNTEVLHETDPTRLLEYELRAFVHNQPSFTWTDIDREVAVILELLNE